MRVDDFNFELPPDRIALVPVSPRDASRLLHVTRSGVEDQLVRDLPGLLRPGDLLVMNDTKVIPAQLYGVRSARDSMGSDVEIDVTLHKDLGDDCWRVFVRPGKRLREGDEIRFGEALKAKVLERQEAEAVLKFDTFGKQFNEALSLAGVTPLPPYISRKRAASEQDKIDYQTVYADESGSVAAPTAGLHFTDSLFEELEGAGVGRAMITLHVGAGTFLPVTAEDTKDHVMHAEWGEITKEQAAIINEARARGGRIVAIGTTALRLLESASSDEGVVSEYHGETDIFITPGYRFKIVDLLMTNFHLPRSTLFMLVSAFSGTERMKSAYRHAIENQYRFYSYGDACLLERMDEV